MQLVRQLGLVLVPAFGCAMYTRGGLMCLPNERHHLPLLAGGTPLAIPMSILFHFGVLGVAVSRKRPHECNRHCDETDRSSVNSTHDGIAKPAHELERVVGTRDVPKRPRGGNDVFPGADGFEPFAQLAQVPVRPCVAKLAHGKHGSAGIDDRARRGTVSRQRRSPNSRTPNEAPRRVVHQLTLGVALFATQSEKGR